MSGRQIVYTDPLAAAWMAKAHGVRFADREGNPVYVWGAIANPNHDLDDEVFAVHPDSLALYEPRVGDVVQGDDRLAWSLLEGENMADYREAQAVVDYEGRIIQRDCKAWIGGEVSATL